MFPIAKLLFSSTAAAIAFLLWKLLQFAWYHPLYKSPLRHLRGPKRTGLILGNLGDILSDVSIFERWVSEYGNTLRLKGLINENWLMTVDTCAVHCILIRTDTYQKAPATKNALVKLFGEGLFVVEGTQHRQQRRIMNPAFSPMQIRALTDTFFEKAIRLRDLWFLEIAEDRTATITGTRINVAPWLSSVTLDIIGLTGFNYNFDALQSSGQPNKLREVFTVMFLAAQGVTVFDSLLAMFPVLRLIPNRKARKVEAAQRTMTRIGNELLMNAKAAALAGATGNGEIEKNSLQGRDLLSLLVKANIATNIPESQKLSDKEVIAQLPTFLVAGHETTSLTVVWALYCLTQAPEVQGKLRDELLAVDTDTLPMDELMALPYLDTVLRETLRMYPPVPVTARSAMKDDVLPVDEPYTDRYGIVRDTISIVKGEQIFIPIQAMNRSKELWGPDAHEFNPERWNNVPEAASKVPGTWAHLLTFIGGPRACIGFQFSLVESKAILFTLIRALEFELAVPASEIGVKWTISQRPVLRGDPTQMTQLPLLVRPHQKI